MITSFTEDDPPEATEGSRDCFSEERFSEERFFEERSSELGLMAASGDRVGTSTLGTSLATLGFEKAAAKRARGLGEPWPFG